MNTFLTIDLETGFPSETDIQAEIAAWKPSGNAKKEETIERQRAEAEQKIRERSALLDSAPVVSIACQSDCFVRVFHSLKTETIPGVMQFPAPDEKTLLLLFRAFLDGFTTPETVLVGHNIRGFDLPKLRLRYLANGLRLPGILQPNPDTRTDDTMLLFSRYFAIGNREFVSLDEMGRKLGIVGQGKYLSGAEVPAAVAAGRHTEVVVYNVNDVLQTTQAWQRLTSKVGE